MLFVSFFSTAQIWLLHVIFSSNNTHRNLIVSVLYIALLANFNSRSFKGILSLTESLCKNVYLVFLIFNDSLFALTILQFYVTRYLQPKKVLKYYDGKRKD